MLYADNTEVKSYIILLMSTGDKVQRAPAAQLTNVFTSFKKVKEIF